MRMGSRGHQARAACAAPTPAAARTPALLPLLRVLGSGMHMGGTMSQNDTVSGSVLFLYIINIMFAGSQKHAAEISLSH